MGFEAVRVPDASTRIYKDECVLTFKTSESEGGLFVCMKTFLGFARMCLDAYFAKTMNDVFLRIKTTKVKKPAEEEDEADAAKKPTKMAIGVEGGFDVDDADKYEFHHEYAVVTLPDMKEYPLDSPELPDNVKASAAAIVAFDSAQFKDETAAWEEQRQVSKHAADLAQLDNGIKVPPGNYKCEKCDITDNLWLNLTDGSILCGRRFFDGSGGNNHAVDHFNETGYPLAVKLGTITPEGADVYSYAEDDMVIDPQLDKHLAHFGINILEQKKTAKTMTELEIEANERLQFEFDAIQESGVTLEPAYGPGHTGMKNLGNSCYMNTVLQVLFSLEEVAATYGTSALDRFLAKNVDNPVTDLNIQLHKVGYGLVSGDYSSPPAEEEDAPGITPRMFKDVANSGHAEFSSGRQQDAMEYWAYLMDKLQKDARKEKELDVSTLFSFDVEELVRCNASNKVRLSAHQEGHLAVPVTMELMTNKDEYDAYKARTATAGDAAKDEPVVRPAFDLSALIEASFQPQQVEDWYSPAIQAKTSCTQTQGFKTFPKYLVVAVNKFYLGDDWTPKKLDMSLHVPDELDVTHLRSKGKQEGDEDLPEEPAEQQQQQQVQLDEGMVTQLASMGFPLEGCKKAVFHNPQNYFTSESPPSHGLFCRELVEGSNSYAGPPATGMHGTA
ncbi:ubiquitin carboxyl-terminal hydrolase [Salpingoeca rosetta]|uniref:ubiquitinyl hydrolase 1 n=1 Tax=Salpingoeca rosetta (strain ATCC 50818 / BSB-021) TaxID=946362 RepID=F2UEL0_SALR5|nr:ubiquitin carboxyl-terminal hydrolase [Salpingoeca rosetta]EGD75060.1 ubiquitin carboxyl-terminal hydrolase [Salpingoeca rosetta]|eukprot:XP_004992113.1 ubiquitin carboxyl-terminal hydrolase [Salpingoeca rosetta]